MGVGEARERQGDRRKWRKTEIHRLVEEERKGEKSTERKIQEIDCHGTGVSREREGEGI